jgi:hypothetical protein
MKKTVHTMTLQLELKPDLEANLKAQAASQGVGLEQFALTILEERAASRLAGPGKLTVEGFDQMLRQLAQGAEKLPRLPTSAFSRESIYDEHP